MPIASSLSQPQARDGGAIACGLWRSTIFSRSSFCCRDGAMKPSKPENLNEVPMIEASPDQETFSATTAESRAERLVAEYLRVWGLRDPQTIALFAKHWVEVAASDPSLKK